MAKDVVCGMSVDEKKGDNLKHKGKTYYFCNSTCKWAFKSNPEQFIKGGK